MTNEDYEEIRQESLVENRHDSLMRKDEDYFIEWVRESKYIVPQNKGYFPFEFALEIKKICAEYGQDFEAFIDSLKKV